MATNTPKLLAQTVLTNGGPDTVYTVPASTTAIINHISIKNTHATLARSVLVEAGDSGSEREWAEANIDAGKMLEFNGVFILEAADVLKMTSANGTDLDVFVTGLEQT